MKRSDFPAHSTEENPSPRLVEHRSRTVKTIHLLVIGPCDETCALYDAFFHEVLNLPSSNPPTFQEILVLDYRQLWVLPEQHAIDVALLRDTLSEFELEEACRFIRHQWPTAKILALRAGEDFLEDALYDERVTPNAPSEVLLRALEQLLKYARE